MTSKSLPMLGKRIANRLGRPFGINPFPRAFPNVLATQVASTGELFDVVFHENYWGSSQSRSGVGSEPEFAAHYRAGLQHLLHIRGFRSAFDAPCGDLKWMIDLIANAEINYQGGDISKLVIDDLHIRLPQLNVQIFDICTDAFPDADVWHCRDCLFHLPFADIRRAFENFTNSTIPYALLTTHSSRLLHQNLDVTVGGFRFLDLSCAPICLPKAEHYIPDFRRGLDFPRYVGLWSRAAIGAALEKWKV